MKPVCGNCGAAGVRIYRDYGMFRRPEEDRCNACLTNEERGGYVPCILDEDGHAWGYCAVPDADCQKFYALPEKSDTKPHWRVTPSGWSDDGRDI